MSQFPLFLVTEAKKSVLAYIFSTFINKKANKHLVSFNNEK